MRGLRTLEQERLKECSFKGVSVRHCEVPGGFCTESLEGICHGLVLGHVNEPSSQAEVRKDEKHLLQDSVDLI